MVPSELRRTYQVLVSGQQIAMSSSRLAQEEIIRALRRHARCYWPPSGRWEISRVSRGLSGSTTSKRSVTSGVGVRRLARSVRPPSDDANLRGRGEPVVSVR
jgi:hypothetical protein